MFYTLAPALAEQAANKEQRCVYARDTEHGKKAFFTCTRESFIAQSNAHFDRTADAPPLLLYECITHACLFFMDIDGSHDVDAVLHCISAAARFGARFCIYHAPPKQSYHVRGAPGSRVYANIRELRDEITLAAQHRALPTGVDMTIYTTNRLIRCVGSTKWGETRPLIPWTHEGLTSREPLHLHARDLVALPRTEPESTVSPTSVSPTHVKTKIAASISKLTNVSTFTHIEAEAGDNVGDNVMESMQRVRATGVRVYEARSARTITPSGMRIFVDSRECIYAGRAHTNNRVFYDVCFRTGACTQGCFKCSY